MDFQIREMNQNLPWNYCYWQIHARELVQEYIRRGTCFVAERNGQIIGVYVLLPTRPQTVELVNIAVMPSHQGKGIGKKLLKHAIQTAKSWGIKRWKWEREIQVSGNWRFIRNAVFG